MFHATVFPDEASFDHREVTVNPGKSFDALYNTLEEVGK